MTAHGFLPADDVPTLLEEKLASSGLDLDDADALQYTGITAEESRAAGHWPVPALKIPYFDPRTGEPMRFLPDWPDFYRVRWLREPLPNGNKKPAKYLQPKDAGVCAYFPRIGVNWLEIADDWTQEIIITEGELKAAKACKHGIPTIGLGGVDSYQTKRLGFDFLASLKTIVWARRDVVICYDSDVINNPHVCHALQRLAEKLMDFGAIPRMLALPPGPNGEKVGLDDYLLTHSDPELKDHIAYNSQHLTLTQALYDINTRWSFVNSIAGMVRHADGAVVKVSDFVVSIPATAERRELREGGKVDSTMISAGKRWLEWPMRATVDRLTYDPSQPPLSRFYPDGDGVPDFNIWAGWGCEPIKGDVTPFLDLMKHLFSKTTDDAMMWMLRWCGYPIKHPGTKMRTSVIIHGRTQGTGKSSIGYTLREIYGAENFSEPNQKDIARDFNTWAVRKQLIMGDDISGYDKRETLDTMKKMISQLEVYVNEKNKPNYSIPDRANFIWTSNHSNAVALEDEDRRFFVHDADVVPWSKERWDAYYTWLREGGGREAIFHYFLHELDYGDFNPFARAMVTTAKQEMTAAARSGISEFLHDVLQYGPEEMFTLAGNKSKPGDGIAGRDIFTPREIHLYYTARNPDDTRATSRTIALMLPSCGMRKVNNGFYVTGPDDKRDRYWAVRNIDKWAAATHDELSAHLGVKPVVAPEPAAPTKAKPAAQKKPGRKKY